MNSTVIDRRSLILGSIVALGAAGFAGRAFAGDAAACYAAAAQRIDGTHVLLLLSAAGQIVREIPLSARGHDIAVHEGSGRAVAFARRPGTFAVAFNIRDQRPPQVFNAESGRHFYGHGVFSHDGKQLFVTENDYANERGVIGVYDVAAGYRKTGEFMSHGIGPHDLLLLGDGRTLAIANGGVDTVPDAGRVELNLDSMQPSLTFVDCVTGKLIAKHEMQHGLNRLSIRHLAASVDGTVWFGGQWKGAPSETPELIGSAGRDQAIRLIDPPVAQGRDLNGYIGSMAVSRDGTIIAASAPKAGAVLYIDAATRSVRGRTEMKDVCGIAGEAGDTFMLTSGFGMVREEHAARSVISESRIADLAFDNHLRRWG